MTNKMTLKELKKHLEKEYDSLVQEGMDWSVEHDENESVYFITHAYEFAHYNEIKNFFEEMEEEDFENDWKETVSECKRTDRIIQGIYRYWLDFAHPERFNFFCYEDLIDIIKDWFRIYGNKQRIDCR